MRCWLFLLALAAVAALGNGCTTPENQTSSIPWNRPQSWEGQGGMGGLRPPGGGN